MRLMMELEEIAMSYSKDLDEVIAIFEKVNCSKTRLREVLEGKSFTKWTSLEDMAVRKPKDSKEFNYIIKTKGEEAVAARCAFLELA